MRRAGPNKKGPARGRAAHGGQELRAWPAALIVRPWHTRSLRIWSSRCTVHSCSSSCWAGCSLPAGPAWPWSSPGGGLGSPDRVPRLGLPADTARERPACARGTGPATTAASSSTTSSRGSTRRASPATCRSFSVSGCSPSTWRPMPGWRRAAGATLRADVGKQQAQPEAMRLPQRGRRICAGGRDQHRPEAAVRGPPWAHGTRAGGELRQFGGARLVEPEFGRRRKAQGQPRCERNGLREAPGDEERELDEGQASAVHGSPSDAPAATVLDPRACRSGVVRRRAAGSRRD